MVTSLHGRFIIIDEETCAYLIESDDSAVRGWLSAACHSNQMNLCVDCFRSLKSRDKNLSDQFNDAGFNLCEVDNNVLLLCSEIKQELSAKLSGSVKFLAKTTRFEFKIRRLAVARINDAVFLSVDGIGPFSTKILCNLIGVEFLDLKDLPGLI